MRAAWRLATNSLSARPSRSALLIGAVAMSAALVAAIACAMASINQTVQRHLGATVGSADLRISAVGTPNTFDAALLDEARDWPQVEHVAGRLTTDLRLEITRPLYIPIEDETYSLKNVRMISVAMAANIPPPHESDPAPIELIEGRLPTRHDEIAIDERAAKRLSELKIFDQSDLRDLIVDDRSPNLAPQTLDEAKAKEHNLQHSIKIGDELEARRLLLAGAIGNAIGGNLGISRFIKPTKLKIVGIVKQHPLGGREQCYLTLESLSALTKQTNRLSRIDITLIKDADADAAAVALRARLPEKLLLQTTEKITSQLDKNMHSSRFSLILVTFVGFLSATFIILTGLTTGVAERQRQLAIIRCIGGTRWQLASSQILIGLLLGTIGAAIGLPIGMGLAAIAAAVFSEQLPSGLTIWPVGLGLAALSAIGAGVIGACWPAFRAAKCSPLQSLSARANTAAFGSLSLVTLIGLLGLTIQAGTILIPKDGQSVFWSYASFGLPAMFIGYFLLSVPLTLVMVRILAEPISRVLGLPPRLLRRNIAATPYRFGFTAGAMMSGLALMVAIWTNGGAVLRDWLDKIQFPDAFVSGMHLNESSVTRLQGLSFVEQTCAISLYPVETDAFGVRALHRYKTSFIAFDPGPFFDMTHLQWIQGDPDEARARLEEGGAVIVAREFLVAQGLGLGDMFRCTNHDIDYEFEIVGVITSPGLELVSKFFNIGEEFTDQAIHAVFGSRKDLKEKFFAGSDPPIHLIQMNLSDDIDDEAAVAQIRREVMDAGIFDAGSGRFIKDQIRLLITGTLYVLSIVALSSMLIACFGVANLIVAGIDARKFEFGVLRAVGAHRGTLARLVLGEAIIIALTAAILGTLLGVQIAWASRRLYELLVGILLPFQLPTTAIIFGWAVVLFVTIAAAAPAILRLNRRRPLDLLASVKG